MYTNIAQFATQNTPQYYSGSGGYIGAIKDKPAKPKRINPKKFFFSNFDDAKVAARMSFLDYLFGVGKSTTIAARANYTPVTISEHDNRLAVSGMNALSAGVTGSAVNATSTQSVTTSKPVVMPVDAKKLPVTAVPNPAFNVATGSVTGMSTNTKTLLVIGAVAAVMLFVGKVVK